MANNCKITGELEDLAKELQKQNLSLREAGKRLGVSRDTYKLWLTKNNLQLPTYESGQQDKYDSFVNICKEAIQNNNKINLKAVCRDLDLAVTTSRDLIKKFQLNSAIRTRSESAIQDKILSFEEVQKRLQDSTHKVIGFENGKYKIQTPDGFIYSKASMHLNQGDPRNKTGTRLSIEFIRSQLNNKGYELIESSYSIKRKTLIAKHLKCGTLRQNRFTNFFDQECPTCSNTGVSNQEIDLLTWVKSLGLAADKYKFTERITRPQEIDVFVPERKVGIEYCGIHWHCDKYKDEHYHIGKFNRAQKEGIRLITLFDEEWLERNDQVKYYIKSVFGMFEKSISPTKCLIQKIDTNQYNDFIDQNCINLISQATNAYGLFHDNSLVGVISYYLNGTVIVIDKIEFKNGYQVINGESKLVEFIKKNAGICITNIEFITNNRFPQEAIPKRLGFTLKEEISPNLITITENVKIYDCGKKRWVINLT
jgi:hypothetical protein